jgi:flagellar biosynthesis protein FliR
VSACHLRHHRAAADTTQCVCMCVCACVRVCACLHVICVIVQQIPHSLCMCVRVRVCVCLHVICVVTDDMTQMMKQMHR